MASCRKHKENSGFGLEIYGFLENVQRVRAIGRYVPMFLAVFTVQVIAGALLEEVAFADAAARQRSFVLE